MTADAPRYYPATGDGVLLGPVQPSYSAAIEHHVTAIGRGAPLVGQTVLLDLGSLPLNDETTFKRLLNDDPVIAAIFHAGYQLGYDEGRRDPRDC